jgi:predicted nucleic acid-binding Zn ribbon protein
MPPLYDYTCINCGQKEVAVRSVDDREKPPGSFEDDTSIVTPCTDSNGHEFKKVMSFSKVVIPQHHRAAG